MHREKPQLCRRSRSGPLTPFRPGLTGDSHSQCVGVNFRTGDTLGDTLSSPPGPLAAARTLQAPLFGAHCHPTPQVGAERATELGHRRQAPGDRRQSSCNLTSRGHVPRLPVPALPPRCRLGRSHLPSTPQATRAGPRPFCLCTGEGTPGARPRPDRAGWTAW